MYSSWGLTQKNFSISCIFLKWRISNPVILETQCLIGRMCYKLKIHSVPPEIKEQVIILVINIWEQWFFQFKTELPYINSFLESQNLFKQALRNPERSSNISFIWEEIPIILKNLDFFIKPIDCALTYHQFPRDFISQYRFRKYLFILEAANNLMQFFWLKK